MSDGLSMDRDPAPDPRAPHLGEDPAAQPLTEIVLTPPARAAGHPPRPSRDAGDLATIDGEEVTVRPDDDLGACRPRASTR